MAYALNINSVSKKFGKHSVLQDVSISIPEKTVYALLGVNGAGKSTLMKGLVNIMNFDTGSFSYISPNGQEGTLERVGSLIENPKFYPALSGQENLSYLAAIFGIPEQDYGALLRDVGLDPTLTRPLKNYSLGMKQRFGIAVALMGDPEFLILDEPTNGLAPQGVVEMRHLIRELPVKRDVTVMVSSHILSEMQNVATHVGILNSGKICYSGPIQQLLADEKFIVETSHPGQLIKLLQNSHVQFSEVTRNKYWIQHNVDVAAFIAELTSRGIPITGAYVKAPSLEEKFFELTAGGHSAH